MINVKVRYRSSFKIIFLAALAALGLPCMVIVDITDKQLQNFLPQLKGIHLDF